MNFETITKKLIKKYSNILEIEDGSPLAPYDVARTGSVYLTLWLKSGQQIYIRLADHTRGAMGSGAFWAKNYKEAVDYIDSEILKENLL